VDRAFAMLLIAAQIVSPVGWIYYVWFAAGPLAALTFSESRRGFLSTDRAVRWLAVISFAGFFTPITVPYLLQRSALIALTAGSVYVWATLAAWTSLILDFAGGRARDEYRSP